MKAFLQRAGGALLLLSLSFSCSVQGGSGEPTAPRIETSISVEGQGDSVLATTNWTPKTSTPIASISAVRPTQPLSMPSPTPSRQPLSTPSPNSEMSSIQTPVPTLDMAERGELLAQLMKPDPSCMLPCWWQVRLGTPLEEVDSRFRSLRMPGWGIYSSDLGDGNEMGDLRIGYADPLDQSFYQVDVYVRFYTVQDKVGYIEADVLRPLVDYGLADFQRDWEPFFPGSIMEKLGPPSSLYLLPITEAEPGLVNEVLLLYYPEQGINVSFEFRVFETAQGAKELCLEPDNIRGLKLSLFAPDQMEQWDTYLLPPEPGTDESYEHYSWKQRTGQDITSLYQALQEPEPSCIVLQ